MMNKFKRVCFALSAVFLLQAACILSRPAVGNSAPATTPYTGPTAEPAPLTPLAGMQTLHLIDTGQPRLLPNNILGASVESLIEHILDDPQKITAIQQTAPGVIRFPGGSQSNYYNWQTGLLDFNPMPNSSSYYKFWAGVAPKIARAFPTGIHMELVPTLRHSDRSGCDPGAQSRDILRESTDRLVHTAGCRPFPAR